MVGLKLNHVSKMGHKSLPKPTMIYYLSAGMEYISIVFLIPYFSLEKMHLKCRPQNV